MRKDNFHYLLSLYKLAAVDGDVSGEEREYLKAAAEKLGFSLRDIARSKEAAPWTKIKDSGLRKLLIKDLFFVSYADGKQDPKESEFISAIVKSYRLSRKTVSEIDAFVREGIAWIQRGQRLFGVRFL
jgi:uncharacterized tellurite resistance protein B-like protein